MTAALVGLAVVVGLLGAVEVSVPSARATGVTPVPLWVVLPVPFSAVIAGSLHTEMQSFEEVAAIALPRLRFWHVVVAAVLSTTMLGASIVAGGVGQVAMPAIRNLLFWTGLALMCGRVLGWQLSWIAPMAAVFPYVWFGVDDGGGARWWAWPMDPAPGAPMPWLGTCLVLISGLAFALISAGPYVWGDWRAAPTGEDTPRSSPR